MKENLTTTRFFHRLMMLATLVLIILSLSSGDESELIGLQTELLVAMQLEYGDFVDYIKEDINSLYKKHEAAIINNLKNAGITFSKSYRFLQPIFNEFPGDDSHVSDFYRFIRNESTVTFYTIEFKHIETREGIAKLKAFLDKNKECGDVLSFTPNTQRPYGLSTDDVRYWVIIFEFENRNKSQTSDDCIFKTPMAFVESHSKHVKGQDWLDWIYTPKQMTVYRGGMHPAKGISGWFPYMERNLGLVEEKTLSQALVHVDQLIKAARNPIKYQNFPISIDVITIIFPLAYLAIIFLFYNQVAHIERLISNHIHLREIKIFPLVIFYPNPSSRIFTVLSVLLTPGVAMAWFFYKFNFPQNGEWMVTTDWPTKSVGAVSVVGTLVLCITCIVKIEKVVRHV